LVGGNRYGSGYASAFNNFRQFVVLASSMQNHWYIWRAHFEEMVGSGATLPSAESLSVVPQTST
jgi:hypothetical protein